jgi:hypothetical protein
MLLQLPMDSLALEFLTTQVPIFVDTVFVFLQAEATYFPYAESNRGLP